MPVIALLCPLSLVLLHLEPVLIFLQQRHWPEFLGHSEKGSANRFCNCPTAQLPNCRELCKWCALLPAQPRPHLHGKRHQR